MKFRYCPDCGSPLVFRNLGDEKDVPWCEKCSRPWFELFPCCVIVAARRNGRFALIKQYNCERCEKDKYVLVSGYIKTCESAEECAKREVKEELGLDVLSLKLVSSYVYEKKQMLMLGFAADVAEGEFSLSDELTEAHWFEEKEAERLLKGSRICELLMEDIAKCQN